MIKKLLGWLLPHRKAIEEVREARQVMQMLALGLKNPGVPISRDAKGDPFVDRRES